MKTVATLILFFLFHIAYSAFQCYQCSHSEIDQNVDCVNADIKYLQNCSINKPANLDSKTEAISFASGKQITDWTCSLRINITRTSIAAVVRECIERNFASGCYSTGNVNETYMECFCEPDGCNGYVHTFPNTTTTSTTISTTSSTATTTEQATTVTDNGSFNLRQSSVVLTSCYFLAYSLNRAFHFL